MWCSSAAGLEYLFGACRCRREIKSSGICGEREREREREKRKRERERVTERETEREREGETQRERERENETVSHEKPPRRGTAVIQRVLYHLRHVKVMSTFVTATHCNTLQHTATHCNTLQHTATHTFIVNMHMSIPM